MTKPLSITFTLFLIIIFLLSINTKIAKSSEKTPVDGVLSDMPGFIELKEFHPEAYYEIADQVNEYMKVNDQDSIRSLVQTKILEVFTKDLLKAPDGATVLYIDSSTKLFEIAGERDPKCCDSILQGDSKCLEEILTLREMKSYLGMMGIVIRQANANPTITQINSDQAKSDLNKIYISDKIQSEDTCKLAQSIFEGLLELPPSRTANAIKYVMSPK